MSKKDTLIAYLLRLGDNALVACLAANLLQPSAISGLYVDAMTARRRNKRFHARVGRLVLGIQAPNVRRLARQELFHGTQSGHVFRFTHCLFRSLSGINRAEIDAPGIKIDAMYLYRHWIT